ncbi:SMC-Scp complex subunit ScpB [Magnetovibrio sp. PR-2]|uniref:SMC-Scp complex subunit ScpB n=1 Tax=Magnetovibrio sp. PR-2 TaxID=3120356 RepID=UPI002FCDEA56
MTENDNEPNDMMDDEPPMGGDEAAEVETEQAADAAPAKPLDREAQIKAANAAFDELEDDELDDIEEAETQEIDPELVRLLEAVLFASSEPVSERSLSARLPEGVYVKPLLKELMGFYEGRGVLLVRRGGSWAFRTAPDLGQRLNLEVEVSKKLSRAAIETLAIIAYHQPVTRAEIEEIRGVSLSKGTLDLLFEETWIKPRGRRETPGRPMQWGTSDNFLDHFGLASVSELPGLKELRAMGLLDSRPAIQAYSSRADMQSSEEVQKNMEFKESEIVRAETHAEDADVTVPALDNTPLEEAIEATIPAPEPEPEPEEELDASGATKRTADKLDAAMEAVAGAVKSAVEALEREEDEDEEV